MPGRKPRTNRFLILIAILLCLIFGAGLTQSSANPSPIQNTSSPDMFVAENADNSAFTAENTITDTSLTDDSGTVDSGDSDFGTGDSGIVNSDTGSDNAGAINSGNGDTDNGDSGTDDNKTADDISSTAANDFSDDSTQASPTASAAGVWISNGSSWMFLVDGVPHTGWLFDTDGKHYYFNSDGIMQTGWLDDNGKRYYLDLDGIMQTGDITIGKETYHLLDDGSLDGYEAETTAAPTPAPTAAPTAAPEKDSDSGKKKKRDKRAETKTIALTFDDGPSSFTDRLLTCLEENNAKATFFMVGQEISNFPDSVKRMDALGCELGNHTYNHIDLTTLGPEDITSQIGQTDQKLLDLVGHGATVVRPPYGSINSDVEANIGTPMIIWSVDTLDWKTLDVQQTVDTIMSNAADGAIILMHDIYETSVQAAEIVIPQLIEEGYELVTVHELAQAHGVELKTGIAYGAMN